MALSPLLQARAVFSAGTSRGASVGALWIFVLNSVAWLSYGLDMASAPQIVPNAVALVALSVAIATVYSFRRKSVAPDTFGRDADLPRAESG